MNGTKMKTAFPIWGRTNVPVFDVARQVFIVEMEFGILFMQRKTADHDLPIQKALRLAELGVGNTGCIISRPPGDDRRLRHSGHTVTGLLHEVVQAWLSGGFNRSTYAMPGCFGGAAARGAHSMIYRGMS